MLISNQSLPLLNQDEKKLDQSLWQPDIPTFSQKYSVTGTHKLYKQNLKKLAQTVNTYT